MDKLRRRETVRLTTALALVAALLALGCSSSKKRIGEYCSQDSECESGICFQSKCAGALVSGPSDVTGVDASDLPGLPEDVATGDAPPDMPAAGTLDGTWRVDGKVCNGKDVDMTSVPETHLNVQGTTGSFSNSVCTIPITLSYPASSQVDWVIGQVDCAGSTTGTGDHHSATYTVSDGILTLTEAMTPAAEWGCPSGTQVSTLTKL